MEDARREPHHGLDPGRFPNTRLRSSVAGSVPNGLASNSRSEPSLPAITSVASDPDTCRICRGEGTSKEPLFYPCKCSGSIKYVHQDCLMEWLSHSQKKHCELCKTPFRFTKLYAPNMPKELPSHVFLSHMVKYTAKNVLVWLRAAMVVNVWLGWLPYLMRSAWSFLFWISDEGLGGGSLLWSNGTAVGPADGVTITGYGSTMCPSSPLFHDTTTTAALGGLAGHLPVDTTRLVRGLEGFNFTTTDPFYMTILRLIFFGNAGSSEKIVSNATAGFVVDTALDNMPRHPSLLSGASFLRNLTRSPHGNRVIIAILEGQLITIVVIVCFILIILVRDYVVQQQPEINMRAAFAAAEHVANHGHAAPNNAAEEAHAPLPALEELGVAQNALEDTDKRLEEGADDSDTLGRGDAGVFGRVRRRRASATTRFNDEFPDTEQDDGEASGPASTEASHDGWRASSDVDQPEPQPEACQPKETPEAATVHLYIRLYREANGDAETILRLAKEQNLEEKLADWMRLTESLVDRDPSRLDAWRKLTGGEPLPSKELEEIDEESLPHPDAAAKEVKGKARMGMDWEDGEDGSLSPPPLAGPAGLGRPRANTDGPPLHDGINALANNNWSFSDVAATQRHAQSFRQESPEKGSDESYPTPPSSTLAESGSRQASMGPRLDEGEVPASDETVENVDWITHQQRAMEGLETKPPTPPRQDEGAGPAGHGLVDRVADFMWRDVDAIDPAELAPEDAVDEWAGMADLMVDIDDDDEDDDADVLADARAAALDPEAIEDAEDLEGILELLGMRGPVAGLFQNAIFCAFLVSITIFLGVFVPYNIGRITLWTVANPTRPARMLISMSKFLQDCVVVMVGGSSCALSFLVRFLGRMVGTNLGSQHLQWVAEASSRMSANAFWRIVDIFMTELPLMSTGEMRNFSVLSHEALLSIKGYVGMVLSSIGQVLAFILGGNYSTDGDLFSTLANTTTAVWAGLKDVPETLSAPASWVIDLKVPETVVALNPELAYWNGTDRFWATMAGYLHLSLMAALYLRRGSPFSSSATGQEWEASIIDGLKQASGVMKVILIIGIEMLVFPLYCGLLLDVALLPLFEDTSLRCRAQFTVDYPLTSVFVHWFVGTGYMFHFALFVSMCRKIMRKGVLYFIRDPDDAEFHPVRDVLERNVTTQLRKILFSAFVYGALVVVCLGGVVWGLAYSVSGVFPIHYSSNEPVLEFPIDLLFYNFLMPLAVKFFRPSHGLHAMYTWWFRQCARSLRITWFLFGERRIDEEGRLQTRPGSAKLPWWRTMLLELNEEGDQVVPKTWRDVFEGGLAKPSADMPPEVLSHMTEQKEHLVRTRQLLADGRFVRTPASDQVKIPKGRRVFLDVTEQNQRFDGRPDGPDTDLFSTDQYQLVYVPPNFRARVFLFILSIWLFAACTGVGITVVPLVFGRYMFKMVMPQHIRTNDIYAFSIGIYVLGSAIWTAVHLASIYARARALCLGACMNLAEHDGMRRTARATWRGAKLVYTYVFLLVVFPLLVASLMELYALIPLHTYMYSMLLASDDAVRQAAVAKSFLEPNPKHSIRIIQAWTIGLLYLKLGSRVVTTWFDHTRLAAAVRAVLRRGWMEPDVKVLTRAFVIPGLLLWTAAVVTPLVFAKITVAHGLAEAIVAAATGLSRSPTAPLRDAYLVLIYRLSFPTVAVAAAAVATAWSLVGVFGTWKLRIRDEAYLIGERLHNFGGTKDAALEGARAVLRPARLGREHDAGT